MVVFGYGTGESEGVDVALVSGPTTTAAATAVEAARAAGILRVLVDIEVTLDTPTATARERRADLDRIARPDQHAASDRSTATGRSTDSEATAAPETTGRPAFEAESPLSPESGGRLVFSGSSADLVVLLAELAPVADGVRLHPADLDVDLPLLARYVLPALLRTGLAHRPVPGSTLRANLGLARPVNRYAKEFAR